MNYDKLIDALFTQGWFVWDDFLAQDEVKAVKACIPNDWSQAGIGRNDEYTTQKSTCLVVKAIVWDRRMVVKKHSGVGQN